ncbi:MAG TPA: stage V sporulation protein B [Desulfotomaculum sp.]|nr:MAG: polysaccharide biosynthesis protein [Desulfotomaculum sp. BICA1-6]HBX22746.1 stage V sporulation protein B [Desulfotomaculum sp.]
MAANSFLQGALVLLAAGLINRGLGFFYQIALIRTIGPEGVGLFSIVFPVYIMILVLATAGIPLAVAKLVAEEVARQNMAGAYRILKLALFMLLGTSLFFTLLMVVGAPYLRHYVFPNPAAYYSFICLVPGISIVSICSAFRGFFQGLQQMSPTAVSQTVEQLVRVVAGLLAAYMMLPRGIEYASAGLSVGVVLGELAGFMLMLHIYRRDKPVLPGGELLSFPGVGLGDIIRRVLNMAVPVTLTRFAATALMSLQAVMIPHRLQAAGLSVTQATSVYGQFVGITEALLFIPGVVTMALATALIPAVSDAVALNNLRLVQTRVYDAVRLTIQVGLPAGFIFIVLGDELCGVLFGYPEAGKALRLMAPAGLFLYLQQTTTAIVQGMGRADLPFKNLVISSVFCLGGIYWLTAMPQIGILGTALAVAVSYLVMAALNLRDIKMLTGYRPGFREHIMAPLFSAGGMSMLVWSLKSFLYQHGIGDAPVLAISLSVGAAAYILLMIISGGFDHQDREKFRHILKFRRS